MAQRVAIIFVVLAAASASAASAAPPKPGMSIFVIAGQSNAAGYGQPIPAETPNPRVFDLTHTPKVAADPIGDAPGVGPGRYFGLYLAKRGMRVGLVNCAAGGTFLSQWQPDQRLFQMCVTAVQSALQYGHLSGVLFMQGESDEEDQGLAATWAPRFALFVSGIRAAFAAPALPVVFGRVLDFTSCGACDLPYGALVHQQQSQVRLPGVRMVNADDLPIEGEHFTVPGYNVLGNRMAQSWISMLHKSR